MAKLFENSSQRLSLILLNTLLQIEEKEEETQSERDSVVYTEYFEWCCKYFAQSVMCVPEENDPESTSHQEHEFQLVRAARVKKAALEEQTRAGEDNIMYNYLYHPHPKDGGS